MLPIHHRRFCERQRRVCTNGVDGLADRILTSPAGPGGSEAEEGRQEDFLLQDLPHRAQLLGHDDQPREGGEAHEEGATAEGREESKVHERGDLQKGARGGGS